MNKKVVIMSDKDSKTITEWLKMVKEKEGIKWIEYFCETIDKINDNVYNSFQNQMK